MYTMQSLYLICTLSLAMLVQGLEAYNVANHSRIVGGKEATLGQFPFQVALIRLKKYFLCGGCILNSYWILSAAHCIIVPKDDIVALIKSVILNKGGDVHELDKIIVHELHNDGTKKNDISLLKTQKAMKFSANAQPIKLATSLEPANSLCTVLGWGSTQDDPEIYPNQLNYVEVKTISATDCEKKVGSPGGTKLDKSQLCLYGGVGKGTCSGDSGSPAVVKKNGQFTAIGITSFGIGECGRYMPDIFTSIPEYIGWINKNMK